MIQLLGPALAGARALGGVAQVGRFAAGLGSLLGAGLTADAARRTTRVGSIPPKDKFGESYRDAELRLGNRGGSGGNAGYSTSTGAPQGTFSPATERAYQQEVSRVAQLTAQDPELQRYEAARQKAKLAGPGSAAEQSAEDLGMQMWRNKYRSTPMGRTGGAVGAFNPLMQSTFGYQAGMSPNQITQTITNPSTVPVAPGAAPFQMGDLGTRATGDTGYDPAAYGLTPDKIKEMKEKLLLQAGK
jgi:hypothetical protein